MIQYPIKTRQYPGRPTSPPLTYIHRAVRPKDRTRRRCFKEHHSLRAAFNCSKNKGHADRIAILYEEATQSKIWAREVLTDELVINGLAPPTRLNHALLVHLQVRRIPDCENLLKEREHRRPPRDDSMAYDQPSFEIYCLVRMALLLHNFYTTPLPRHRLNNQFAALLPLDQYPTYQDLMDKSVETTLAAVNRYNDLKQYSGYREALPQVLSYSLEEYPSKGAE